MQEGAYDVLSIWHNVGRDIDNGIWCMLGARMGTYMTMLTNWDYKIAENEEQLKQEVWSTIDGHNPDLIAAKVGEELITQLELPIIQLDSECSKFFKKYCLAVRT